MPVKVTVENPADGEQMFACRLNRGCQPCHALTRSGARCTLKSCNDMDYCWLHLRKEKRVQIGPSRLTNASGQSFGRGLFAMTKHVVLSASKLAQFRAGGGTEKERADNLVFAKGQTIGLYKGDVITKKTLDKRYDDKGTEFTAPYAIDYPGDGKVTDALCQRNFVALANDPHGTNARANAKVVNNRLKAIRNIWRGEEILWNYGTDYWESELPRVREKRVR